MRKRSRNGESRTNCSSSATSSMCRPSPSYVCPALKRRQPLLLQPLARFPRPSLVFEIC